MYESGTDSGHKGINKVGQRPNNSGSESIYYFVGYIYVNCCFSYNETRPVTPEVASAERVSSSPPIEKPRSVCFHALRGFSFFIIK